MRKINKPGLLNIIKFLLYFFITSIIISYVCFLTIIPLILNNGKNISKIESFFSQKTGSEISILKSHIKTTPLLTIEFSAKNINLQRDNKKVINIDDLQIKYDIKTKKIPLILSNNIYINGDELNKIFTQKKNSKSQFDTKKLTCIDIKNIVYTSDSINIKSNNLKLKDGYITLFADIKLPYIKNIINAGYSGNLYINNKEIKATNFEVSIGGSKVYLDGYLNDNKNSHNFTIKGNSLPVDEIESILLHWQKSQDPAKKFIENFRNYSGTIDIDLRFNKEGILGNCVANKLSAKAVWFDIPLYFNKAVFEFLGNKVYSKAIGQLGKEKVVHTLNITNLGTDKKEVIGSMDVVLKNTFNYVHNLTVVNSADANITYKIKYKKIDVFYTLKLNPASDLIYKSSYLGLRDNKRQLYAHTLKDCNDLHLKDYDYSVFRLGIQTKIISGDGLFVKKNDKYTPQYITCHTNGYAPVSVTGSFGEKLSGGEFSGNLKYDYIKEKLTGSFDIQNAKYNNFHVEKAVVSAKENNITIISNGKYMGEKYSAKIYGDNNFKTGVNIHSMKLFLDKLVLRTNNVKKQPNITPQDITKKAQNTDITIDNWEILINEIKRGKISLKKAMLIGSLKNDIFDFNMPELVFAEGKLNAKGKCNFKDNSSEIDFNAQDINSNYAADMIFDLKNQVEGIANAKLKLKAYNSFKDINAHCCFEIDDGFLPKIGNTEFMIKNSKFKLSEITNLDLTQKQLLKSDIKGSLDMYNTKLNNICLTSQQDFLSLYIEGDYDIKKQYANLNLFGKYNKEAPKGIKILFIPLNLILNLVIRPENSKDIYKTQIMKIPNIKAPDKYTKYFRVQFNGDINNGKVETVIKGIK